MDASEASTLPGPRPCHSQSLEPGTLATYTLPNNEARVQLPDVTNREKRYLELLRKTTNKHRPDLIVTAVSILPLSQTCRYLHKVTSTSLLETIRLEPPSSGRDRYLSVIKQVKSLHLNGDHRLQHVRSVAVAIPDILRSEYSWYESDLRNQICHLLVRFPNLRHLTVIGVALDAPLMHNILTLPLEHLWLWNVKPDGRIADQTFNLITAPRIKLRSLVLLDDSWRSNSLIPINWVSQLIGTDMRDLSLDASELVPPALPVLQDLEVLEFPDTIHTSMISPSMLYRLLSKALNLKEATIQVKAASGDPADTIPALSHLERVVCHGSWLHSLAPGRPITTAQVLCDSQVRVQELFEVLREGSVPLRGLALTYATEWGRPTWSPNDLEPIARCLPELENFRLHVEDYKLDGLKKALDYISQLQKLRIVLFSCWSEGLQDDVWQESNLRVSRFNEIAGFGGS